MMTGLDLPRRAELLGLDCRAYLDLVRSDRRVIGDGAVATIGAVARLRRWLDAGRPAADLGRLVFIGDDPIRTITLSTIKALPAPVQWHAVTSVTWFATGRTSGGWAGTAPHMPKHDDDEAHIIMLSGATSDSLMPGHIAHELAHSWHRAIGGAWTPPPDHVPRDDLTHDRMLLSIGLTSEMIEMVAKRRYFAEVIADRLAGTWGFPCHASGHDRLQGFRAELAAAAATMEPSQ
jgi:hypothetical protein